MKFNIPVLSGKGSKRSIKADVIILGCSLPGIVTAHKLKRKFGNTMDIVVLDLAGTSKTMSKCNVAFQEDSGTDTESEHCEEDETARQFLDNVARHYLAKYAKEFRIPLPDAIVVPERVRSPLNKLFQHRNGSTVSCRKDYHDFDYLSFMEKLEMNQYQNLIDQCMRDLFQENKVDTPLERRRLLYYDRTTMEQHLCNALLFPTSREIMRTTVALVCGAPASIVSVLFYLHQCYRTSSARNHLDGDNTRFREKLLGYCRKHFASKLQQSIADITVRTKSIKQIRTYSDQMVILETIKGESNYVCSILTMALRPDELHNIRVEDSLLSETEANMASAMIPGRVRKFLVQYEENFWSKQGYSGDILSIRGPIIWAMERPKMSTTGSLERYAALIGYLMVSDDVRSSRESVMEQLVKVFGDEAAIPVSYRETDVADVFVPRCGDYVALRRLTKFDSPRYLEWGALDIYADGDVAAAMEAGHATYLHLLSCLRPQAQTYEDLCLAEWPSFLSEGPLTRCMAHVNIYSTIRWTIYTAALVISVRLLRAYMRK